MIKLLINADIEKCNGCRLCEVACSLKQESVACPSRARIEIIEVKPDVWVPVFCFQCEDAICVKVCPVNALKRDTESDLIIKDNEVCINCKACVFACPFGAMGLNIEGKTFKCDLCDGEPICVKVCPTEALTYTHPENITYKKKLAIAEKLLIP